MTAEAVAGTQRQSLQEDQRAFSGGLRALEIP
jgi:hypothetical protein